MSKIIGIDLGTTNSAVAVMEGDDPKIILNEEGARTTPSIIAFTKEGERVVGAAAKRQSITNPENTVYSAKRFMGMQFKDVRDEAQQMPYSIKRTKDGSCRVHISKDRYAPQQLSAMILQKLKRSAESYLGHEVTEAVITVPAYFNDAQRQATKEAGKIAGLEVKRIINEPTAAALAYGLNTKNDQKIAVYDLGGGTFDISILDVSAEVVEVLSTNGDTHLGGDDVDTLLINWLTDEFKKDTGIDISADNMVTQRLKEAAEKAKIELSSTNHTEINLPFLTADASGPKHLTVKLTKAKFNRMIKSFVSQAIGPVKNALKDAKLKATDIDEVILVGGSTRIPAVREAVEKFFGKKANNSVNPDEVVALGAAVQGGVFSGDVNDLLLLDVTPLSLGIETLGGVKTNLIERNTTIPCKKSEIFSTARDGQADVDINVLQGERQFVADNKTLGKFKLDGITPAPRGIPQIEVTFDIDANGIVSVSAQDKKTGKEQSITIEGASSLDENEINQMVEDAKQHKQEDAQRKQNLELLQNLDSVVYQAETLLRRYDETLEESVKENLTSEIINAKNLIEEENYSEMGDMYAVLSKSTSEIAIEMMQKEQAESKESADTDNTTNSD